MAKYHFEIDDGIRLEDPVGFECPTESQAKSIANDIARQIAEDIDSTRDRRVVVLDDHGREVYSAKIAG